MWQILLICLQEPDADAIASIIKQWRKHYVLNDSQVLIAVPNNGGKPFHSKLAKVLGDEFVALIVRVRDGSFEGRHDVDLWEWLASHVSP